MQRVQTTGSEEAAEGRIFSSVRQGTQEWFDVRRGKVTASRVSDVIARTKTGWGASRGNYLAELVAERLTGATAEGYESPAMKWGKETEPEAAEAYAFYVNAALETVAFVDHPRIQMSGASPDRLVGAIGLVEIKAPNTATHIDTLLNDTVPDKYIVQMQWQMACTDRQWCDFVSFDPRLPERMRLYVRRFDRDDLRIDQLEAEVRTFLAEVERTVVALQSKFAESVAA
jgi:putative phage-type endonuclease